MNEENILIACDFARWIDIVAVRNGQDGWKYRGDNYVKIFTSRELFDVYLFDHANTIH